MDAGDIILQEEIDIGEDETAGDLAGRIAPIGARLLLEAVKLIEKGEEKPVPQDHTRATYCPMIRKEDGRIDWSEPAEQITRQVRAYNPWPVAFTSFGGQKLSIRRACVYRKDAREHTEEPPGKVIGVDKEKGILIQTIQGILAVEELQLQSRKALCWSAFLNGTPGFTGSILGGE